MQYLRLLWLVGLLWLAGCAIPPAQRPASGNADATHQPLYPDGPLSPIASSSTRGRTVTGIDAPTDLWDRIRRGFAMPDLVTDQVRDREQWYATRPDAIQRMTERSSKYLFYIVEEIERRGMPSELALLPFIESAFNPQAVSSANAAGIWQFMPATGSYFDLKQNAFRDDRRDVLASTRAALDYLQKLYGMFGDWQLALAAYNWGEGSVARAIARNEKQGLGTGYLDLNMPAETRMYVPKLQAIKNIIANPDSFNVDLPLIGNHPYFQSVEITRDIDVALVSSLAGIRVEDFRALNPSLQRPVILAAGMPQILLPWDNAQVFRKNLQAYSEGQYASWTVWAVPNTMTVASAAKQMGMEEDELRRLNGIPPHMMIKAGSALMVKRAADNQQNVSSHLADNGRIAFTPEVVTRRTTLRAGKHDTVASIAQRYKVKVADVADWNDVKHNSRFKPGERIIMYLPMRQASPARTAVHTSAKPTRTAKAAPAKARVARAAPSKRRR